MRPAPDYRKDLHPDCLMLRCRKRPWTRLVVSIALPPGWVRKVWRIRIIHARPIVRMVVLVRRRDTRWPIFPDGV